MAPALKRRFRTGGPPGSTGLTASSTVLENKGVQGPIKVSISQGTLPGQARPPFLTRRESMTSKRHVERAQGCCHARSVQSTPASEKAMEKRQGLPDWQTSTSTNRILKMPAARLRRRHNKTSMFAGGGDPLGKPWITKRGDWRGRRGGGRRETGPPVILGSK